MAESDSAHPNIDRIAFDERGNLLDDIPCRHCGYNLKGQNPDRPCSECGTPIGRSVLGNLLRYADPGWMVTVSKGTGLLAISLVLLLLSSCLMGALFSQLSPTLGTTFAQGVSVLLSVLMLTGAWMMTTPEPTEGETSSIKSRKVARAGVVAGLLGVFLNLVASTVPLRQGSMIAIQAVSMVLALVNSIGTVAIFYYLRSLATRIPDERLARRTTIVLWGFGLFYSIALILVVVTIFLGVLAPAAAPGTAPPIAAGMGGMMIGACFFGGGALIFGLLALLTLDRYRLAFKAQAKLARETWAASLPA